MHGFLLHVFLKALVALHALALEGHLRLPLEEGVRLLHEDLRASAAHEVLETSRRFEPNGLSNEYVMFSPGAIGSSWLSP